MAWTAVKTYHWTQTFQAHKILHVRHVYAPILGYGGLQPEVVFPVPRQDMTPEFAAAVRDSCIDAVLQKTLTAAARKEKKGEWGYIGNLQIDYILTTANTWRTPIKDFELIVERPKPQPPAVTPAVRAEFNHQLQLAAAFEKQQKYADAIKAYREALRLVPGDAKAKRLLEFAQKMDDGTKSLSSKKFADAARSFEEALKLSPGNQDAAKALQKARQGRP